MSESATGWISFLNSTSSLSRQKANSKATQNKFKTKAVIKHWLEGNSVKCYNKSGCLLRVETTINKPDLPGLKLKKPAINLMAYFWHGLGCNSRYIETILDIDLRILNDEVYRKYQDPITNKKGVKIAAPDLRKDHQVEFLEVLLSSSHRSLGFRNKDLKQILTKDWKTAQIAYELRKLRERGAVKKLQSSHYYQLTKDKDFENPDQASIIEGAYSDINRAVSLIASEFKLVS